MLSDPSLAPDPGAPISVTQITRSFEDRCVLDDVTFTARPGRVAGEVALRPGVEPRAFGRPSGRIHDQLRGDSRPTPNIFRLRHVLPGVSTDSRCTGRTR